MMTIPEKFRETVKKFPNRKALKFKFQGAYIGISFSELARRVDQMAKGLQNLGIIKGDKVAILSENRTEWVRTDLATLTLGAISVPIHTTLSAQIIKHVINDSGSKVIVVSNQEQFNKLSSITNDLPNLQVIIFIDLDHSPIESPESKKMISLSEVMTLGNENKGNIDMEINSEDVASIIYTSGTTSMPKGVMLTHGNFMFAAESGIRDLPVTQKDVLLSFLPLSHVLERTAGYYAPLIVAGCCIAFAENVKTLKTNFQEVKPTIIVAVPRIFEKIHVGIWDKVKAGKPLKRKIFVWALKQQPGTINHKIAEILVFKKIRKAFGGRLRFTISGGASLNHKLAKFFSRIGLMIIEGYGLTETSPIITMNPIDNIKLGTVGKVIKEVEVRIAPDKEILTKGPNLMKGYYNNDALTKEVIDAEGWFHTGDLGFLNSEGYLIIIGRKKEMISLSNGKIAWPEQIELVFNNDRFISQSFIHGNNKNFLTALIVPDWQEISRNLLKFDLESKEPEEFVNDEKLFKIFEDRVTKINEPLASWEKVKKFVLIPREFSQEKNELTPTMKLRRSQIVENNKSKLDKLY